jgi:hypothetical protein
MNKYEQLIEFIINEDEAKAKELFHQIVVEKSRDIYESLMDEEFGGNQVEELTQQVTADEEGMHEAEEEEFDSEEDEGGEMHGDEMGMHGGDEMGMHDDEGNVEDRVMDLEDALDELKAEFDALMAGEEAEEHDHPGMHDMGDDDMEDEEDAMYEAKDEEDDEEDEEDLEESKMSKKMPMKMQDKKAKKMTEAEWIREYVEKIGEYPGEQSNPNGRMAGTGNKSEKQGERNTKSPVGPGTDMGGTNKNIARGGTEVDPDGKQIEQPSNEYAKGRGQLKDAGKFANVPGGNAGKTSYKTKAEREFGPDDSETGKLAGADGTRPINKKSPMKHIGN